MSTHTAQRSLEHVVVLSLVVLSGCGLFEELELPEQIEPDAGFVDVAERSSDASTDSDSEPEPTRDAGIDADEVETCPANNYVRSGECTRCPSGTRRNAGDDPTMGDTVCAPILCGEDQRVLTNQCIACVPGTRRDEGDDATGSDTVCEPVLCAENERVEDRTCVGCGPGLSNLAGDDASGPNTTCDAASCPSNHRVLENTCSPCAPGTRRDAGDDASGPDTVCEPVTCVGGERVVDNQCSPCAPGSTNDPGDDASGPNTTCDATLCGQGQRVQDHTCVPCAPGEENMADDDASGVNTSCQPVVCAENERVSSNLCVPCDPGSTRPFGDEASGADTSCEATLCAQNQYVLSNQCSPCPAGTTNDPDDDATGADTSCEADPCFGVFGLLCDDIVFDYMKPSNTDAKDLFGSSVALRDGVLVVGAPGEEGNATKLNGNALDNSLSNAGAVYVFERQGTSWDQTDYIKPSNMGSGDRFGASVALQDGLLVVGAPGEASGNVNDPGDDGQQNAGAAYVFERMSGKWEQRAYLKATVTGKDDAFGTSVAVFDDIIVVGAPSEDSGDTSIDGDAGDDSLDGAGAVYAFTRSSNTWVLRNYIKAPNAGNRDAFGASVSLHDGWLVVGAPGESSKSRGIGGNQLDDSAPESGAVYIFSEDPSSWRFNNYVKATEPDAGDRFGASVSVSGSAIAIGAPGESSAQSGNLLDNNAPAAGAVYILKTSGPTWSHQDMIKAHEISPGDQFGACVDLEDTLLLIGAPFEDSEAREIGGDAANDKNMSSGAAYLFEVRGGNWNLIAYIKAPNNDAGDEFGHSVALGHSAFAIGSLRETSAARSINGDSRDNTSIDAGAVFYGPAN